MSAPALVVSEVFGPTLQGEGPSAGRRAAFVRLGGCNLACAWCDTPYTWDWTGKNGRRFDPGAELAPWADERILGAVGEMDVPLVVVTGGEPLLQADRLAPLLDALAGDGYEVEVETNGTVIPGDAAAWRKLVDHFNVSPKLASADNRTPYLLPDVLRWFRDTGRACFKFVCSDLEALGEVDAIVRDVDLIPYDVWIMPEGTTAERVLALGRDLAGPAIERGYNLTLRQQVLLWGDARGR